MGEGEAGAGGRTVVVPARRPSVATVSGRRARRGGGGGARPGRGAGATLGRYHVAYTRLRRPGRPPRLGDKGPRAASASHTLRHADLHPQGLSTGHHDVSKCVDLGLDGAGLHPLDPASPPPTQPRRGGRRLDPSSPARGLPRPARVARRREERGGIHPQPRKTSLVGRPTRHPRRRRGAGCHPWCRPQNAGSYGKVPDDSGSGDVGSTWKKTP